MKYSDLCSASVFVAHRIRANDRWRKCGGFKFNADTKRIWIEMKNHEFVCRARQIERAD